MFKKSAHLYDAIYGDLDQRGHVERIHQLIQQRRKGAQTLLDVACGTGLHLEHFSKYYEVEGLDLDESMLEVARGRLPGVPLHHGDMIDFSLGRTFDAITCLFSSIGYTKSMDGLVSAVANMRTHLSEQGVLIVEPWITPDKWEVGHIGADFVDEPELKVARMARSHLTHSGRVSVLEFSYLVNSPRGIERFDETHELGLFSEQDYRLAFSENGFEVEWDPIGLLGRGLWIGVSS